jgi:hypothetical protein
VRVVDRVKLGGRKMKVSIKVVNERGNRYIEFRNKPFEKLIFWERDVVKYSYSVMYLRQYVFKIYRDGKPFIDFEIESYKDMSYGYRIYLDLKQHEIQRIGSLFNQIAIKKKNKEKK